jgi:hypothetical protein
MTTTSVSYKRSILPVFVGAQQPEAHDGTAFLVPVESHLFLVSAAHVVNPQNVSQRWIPVGGVLTPLVGPMWSTVSTSTVQDRYDVSVMLLDPSLANGLRSNAAFSPPLLRLNVQTGPEYAYTFCGYPGKTVTMDHSRCRATSYLKIYTGMGVSRSKYASVGVSHMSHIGVDLCSKVIDEAGKRIKLGRNSQKGLSGGPVLASTDGSAHPALPRARVVGVAIEYRADRQLLMATQIKPVCDAILTLVPSLRRNFRTSNERLVPQKPF